MSVDPLSPMPVAQQGSRRRKLWDLPGHAHCPVLGVCLPMPALRRLAGKFLEAPADASDYACHASVIAECKRRSSLAEAVHRELDRRYISSLRHAAKAKTSDALEAWWREACEGKDLPGTLWATLTHPRCTPTLEHDVLGEVHMLQHQVGMARRADLQRFESLIEENGIVARELAVAQQRSVRLAQEHQRRSDAQQTQIIHLRAQVISRDTALASAREELQTLEEAVPGLKTRVALAREGERQLERLHELQRALLLAQQEADRQRRRADDLATQLQRRDAAADEPVDEGSACAVARLEDRSVLCVGGRSASVPVYRELIERTGGRFLHHDGGDEDSAGKLDATLAAADLVICQTGCISHAAYWRVKEHCKRTGKRCVFVETPSAAGLRRALVALVPAAVDPATR